MYSERKLIKIEEDMVNTDDVVVKSFPMQAEGPYSYKNYSSVQRQGLNKSKVIIEDVIAEKLDIDQISNSNGSFTIADLGCASGPNTFIAVKNIVEAVKLKCNQHPEFHVYFNDHVANDFNLVFRSKPNMEYFMSGVPGSFYGRLFPKASLQFVHCSYALQWLSMIPNELLDQWSPAWNKGRITYLNAPDEVAKAYYNQYAKDMSVFLNARAEEIVDGGLMALLVLYTKDGHFLSTIFGTLHLMESCLLDMAKSGLITEAKIDSFNVPVYQATRTEVEGLIEHNGCFSIEKIEPLFKKVVPDAEMVCAHFRAIFEGMFKEHFGSEVMDEFFNRLVKKFAASSIIFDVPDELSIILKRKVRS